METQIYSAADITKATAEQMWISKGFSKQTSEAVFFSSASPDAMLTFSNFFWSIGMAELFINVKKTKLDKIAYFSLSLLAHAAEPFWLKIS